MKLKDVGITPGLIHQKPFRGSKIGDFLKAGKGHEVVSITLEIESLVAGMLLHCIASLQIKEIFRVM